MRQLWAQNGGAQMIHAPGDIRHVKTRLVEMLQPRPCDMALVKHVTARQQRRTGHQVRVIRHDQPSLARVDVFVGLRGIARDSPVTARGNTVPLRTHRVGAILDHRDPMGITHSHDFIHVAHMAAHVAEHQETRL